MATSRYSASGTAVWAGGGCDDDDCFLLDPNVIFNVTGITIATIHERTRRKIQVDLLMYFLLVVAVFVVLVVGLLDVVVVVVVLVGSGGGGGVVVLNIVGRCCQYRRCCCIVCGVDVVVFDVIVVANFDTVGVVADVFHLLYVVCIFS